MPQLRQRLFHILHALLFGAALSALAWLWQFDVQPPDMLDDFAAAAGLRPPAAPYGLLWQYVAGPLCRSYGIAAAESILRIAGHVAFGVLAVLSAFLMEIMLPASLLRGYPHASWWRMIVRSVLVTGVVLFCCTEPVWGAFRWFSPNALQVLIALVAAIAFVIHLRTWRRTPLFASFALFGLLAADAPSGAFLLLGAASVLALRSVLRSLDLLPVPEESPFAFALMSWRLTLAGGVGFIAGLALEARAFADLDGFAAFGWSGGEFAIEVPLAYIRSILDSCSPVGLAALFAVAVAPLFVEFFLVRRATDDETHLSYFHGVVFAAFGLLALSQLVPARPLWFWTWGGGCVSGHVLRCIAMFLCALSAVWSLSVFAIELYLRNFRRIETLRFPDAAENVDATAELAPVRRLQRIVRAAFPIVPAAALLCAVPSRAQRMERAMLDVAADAARETAEECRGVKWLFTDGGLDSSVEIAAAAKGLGLRALSMMGGASDPRETYLRTRGVTNAEERALLESGAPDALRTWVRTRPEMSDDYAVQIGFELWRRDGRPIPRCSGLVARPHGLSDAEAERGASAARNLARRILALYGEGNPDGIADRGIRDAFLFAQWRLAVLARHRSNAYDEGGKKELAMEDTRLADALDGKNGALARIRATMAWASRKKLERMTPLEGLKAGLAHADFARARIFAQRVLAVDPDSPEANFAIGMDYFVQKQYSRAEAYLTRCLERRPDDPAVLNNLAQCRLRQGDFKGAMPYARRALAALPDSPEVKRTIERIEKGMQKEASGENGKKEGGTP